MPRPEPLTPDDPYTPDMDAEDAAEVTASVNGTSWARNNMDDRARTVSDVEVQHLNKTLISYQDKLDVLMLKTDGGESLTEEEAAYIVERGLMQILRDSKRSSHKLKALEQLTRMREKKLIMETRVEATAGQLTDGKPPTPRISLPHH